MELNRYYEDRGMMKYNGFYLSEHTASIEKDRNNRYAVIAGKDEMAESDMYQLIEYALFKYQQVSIQLNMKDIEGDFLPDIFGFIEGYDETGLYINETKVPFDLIRHVMLIETTKWYE